jgi:putative ABC transport system substrate-binding protein
MTHRREALANILALGMCAAALPLRAQSPRPHRVGLIHQGGSYNAAVDGLRAGLKELGWEDGGQYVLHARDARGDLKRVEDATRSLESEGVDLICAFATSSALRAKQAAQRVPIVFHVGTDPVKVGLVESLRQPGGRLTGVYTQVTDLTAKRLELLKEMVPRLRRVGVFYNPDNPSARESLADARLAAGRLAVTLVERPTRSAEALRAGMLALAPGEVDAVFHVSDATVTSHADMIIAIARSKKLPLVLQDRESVARGALASYGLSYYTSGRLMAKYVQRVLLGADPASLPVEQVDRLQLVVNLGTARDIGLVVPRSVLTRADEIID